MSGVPSQACLPQRVGAFVSRSWAARETQHQRMCLLKGEEAFLT